MSTQLRADVVRALDTAADQVRTYPIANADTVDDVMRLVDGTLRFLEPDQSIWEARRAVLERLESVVRLIEPEEDRDVPAPVEERSPRAIATARAHALEAINHLRTKVLGQGRVNAAGDRVGLGKVGALLS